MFVFRKDLVNNISSVQINVLLNTKPRKCLTTSAPSQILVVNHKFQFGWFCFVSTTDIQRRIKKNRYLLIRVPPSPYITQRLSLQRDVVPTPFSSE